MRTTLDRITIIHQQLRWIGTRYAWILWPLMSTSLCGQTSSDADLQWPLQFNAEGYEVKVYTPQPETVEGDAFTARAAVSLKRSTDKAPVFGAIWGEGSLAIDRNTRFAVLERMNVTDIRFPDLTVQEADRVRTMLSREIPLHSRPIPIDWWIAVLDEGREEDAALRNDPPEIIYTERPSVLVYIDGEPEYVTLERTADDRGDPIYARPSKDIERVVNTPFLLVRYRRDTHYLYGSGSWFKAADVMGPYSHVKDAPAPLRELAREVDRTEVVPKGPVIPDIVVRRTPAELLDLNGPPQLRPLQSTGLLYAENTEKDLFLLIATQDYYLLSAGRWYATRDLRNGPWRFVPANDLPEDFQKIPEGSPKDAVLAHVPGTKAAREAVRDTRIPQTATVDRKTATLEVSYDGDPLFEPITGADAYLAVNANTTVLRIDGRYHACHNAVWYESDSPLGPWTVSTAVPQEVQAIPPGSPAYHVRYVHIYDHTPDVVFVGYTPGYLGCYVQHGVVVLGTGYYYPRWPGFWYPRPFTWGFNMYYDPWAGWVLGYDWGWYWFYPDWIYWSWYPPVAPWVAMSPWGWWGPWYYAPPWYPEPRPVYYGHRPSMTTTSTRVPTAGHADLYSAQRRPGVTATTVGRTTAPLTGARPSPVKEPTRKPATRDHFPDSEGNIFRRDGKVLERYLEGIWKRVPRENDRTRDPSPARKEPFEILDRRDRGDQRVNDMQRQDRQPAAPARTPTPSRPGSQRHH